jgi:hypothetical protein
MSKNNRVRVGKTYRYDPVLFDILSPPIGAVKGDIVKVVNKYGCPPCGTMGMCYIEKDGKFAGMVMCNSLEKI